LYERGITSYSSNFKLFFIFLKLDREEYCKGRRLHAARSLLIANLGPLYTRFHSPKDEFRFATERNRQNSHDCHVFL